LSFPVALINPVERVHFEPDTEEKREPASDIETGVVDSLKALDLDRPIREVGTYESSLPCRST
jgi:hypothetical protein